MALRAKQERFVQEYLIDFNATQAAKRAGYSERTAAKIGSENLRKPEIAAAIKAGRDQARERSELTVDYVIDTIRETVERCLQHEPVLDRKGNPTGEYQFREAGVLKGCELLGRKLGIWNDKLSLGGDADLLAALAAGRQVVSDGHPG